ncbi:MAG: hypothetical protein PUC12_12305 [Clostridiales bacterium]|nr:hypothetical protein [Clostridiales bacterium]
MKKQIIVELRRVLCSKGMLSALIVGISIVLWHQWQYVWNPSVSLYNCYCPESVYYNWIGASCFPIQSYLFYMILPILASLPAGLSYFMDLHTGYYRQLYLRNRKKEYLTAKYISAFLSGGFAVVIPLIISIYMTAMRFPALRPEEIMDYGPNRTSVGFFLFYEHPWLYILLFLAIDFVFAGGFATISLLSSFFTEQKFAILIMPFAFCYLLFSLDNIFGSNDFAPNYFLNPGFEKNNVYEYAIGAVMIFVVGVAYFILGRKVE